MYQSGGGVEEEEGDDDNNSDIIIHRNSRGSYGRFSSSSCALVELSLLESMCLRGGSFSGNSFECLLFHRVSSWNWH